MATSVMRNSHALTVVDEESASMYTQSECKQLSYHIYTCGKYCYDYTKKNCVNTYTKLTHG